MVKLPRNFVAFDLETTGFAPPCKIIEIGAVKVIDCKIVEEFQTFINPKCRIPGHITGITGIDDSMVAGAPCIEEALAGFLGFIGEFPVAAHNASFDMKFVNFEAERLGYALKNPVIDTLAIARRHYPHLQNHKLGTVAGYLGVGSKVEHRGLQDAMAVAMILLNCCSRHKYEPAMDRKYPADFVLF